ncbi:MAG: class I SAM-dependent methyltransferase [Erysipelotrichales bacterium]|nr:class I SAM-dependent methyltransferase [Erysipelotrichales bacterium]
MNNTNKVYYEKNADDFIKGTINVDMSAQYAMFEKYLKANATILDIGFGSGRDSLYFQSLGHDVTAIDPIAVFCQKGIVLGIKKVINISAEDMNFQNEFDGIWACASLLHIELEKLPGVFKKCYAALHDDGIMYVSFKMGHYEGIRDDRFYVDMDIDSLGRLAKEANLQIIEYSISDDARVNHSEKWINAVMKK